MLRVMRSLWVLFLQGFVILLLSLWSGQTVRAASITVCPQGCDFSTIQGAVETAVSDDTILIGAGVYTETVTISETLTLQGAGSGAAIVDGAQMGPVFTLRPSAVVTVTGLTIRNGSGVNIRNEWRGGGVYNQGIFRLADSAIGNNHLLATDGTAVGEDGHHAYGGGLYNSGVAHLDNVVLEANEALAGDGAEGAPEIDGGSGGEAGGGGIYNACSEVGCGHMVLSQTMLRENRALGGQGSGYGKGGSAYGGGVHNACAGEQCGLLTMSMTTLQDNEAHGENTDLAGGKGIGMGGGLFNQGLAIVAFSVFRGNLAFPGTQPSGFPTPEGRGGAIANAGTARLSYSTLHDNISDTGGGMANTETGLLTIINSTISHNTAELEGGGFYNRGTARLDSVTISDNQSLEQRRVSLWGGGGIFNVSWESGLLILHNTIVAQNQARSDNGDDCFGTLLSQGYNLVGDQRGCTLDGDTSNDLLDVAANLDPLADNGGATPTHMLSISSPVIDAGDPDGCPETDQRGEPRPQDGNRDGTAVCDIGAVEVFVPFNNPIYVPLVMRP